MALKMKTKMRGHKPSISSRHHASHASFKRSALVDESYELPEHVEEESVAQIDPYADLRFNTMPEVIVAPYDVNLPSRFVMVQKPKPFKPPTREEPSKFSLGLKLPEQDLSEKKMGEYVTPMKLKAKECLPRQKELSRSETINRNKLQNAQADCLQNWEYWQTAMRRQETNLSNNVGVSPQKLIFNKSFRLPPLQNHRAHSFGPESDFPQKTQKERFYQGTSFFKFPERRRCDVQMSLTWEERQLYKPPLSVVPTDLGLSQRAPTVTGGTGTKAKIPTPLQHMYVLGHVPNEGSSVTNTSDVEDRSKEEEKLPSPSPHPSLTSTQSVPQPPPLTSMATTTVYNKPCLQVCDKIYAWKETCTENVTEMGMMVTRGGRTKTTLTLSNLGPTVLRYSWFCEEHEDAFGTGRYRDSRFVFDTSDKVLLPKEAVSLSVQFRPEIPGHWYERWHLHTRPWLGPEEGIVILLWGISLDVDLNIEARRKLDKELDRLIGKKIVAQCVSDLIKSLPLQTRSDHEDRVKAAIKMVESAKRPDDVRRFQERNPDLYYCSSAVCIMFEILQQLRQTERYQSMRKRSGKMNWQIMRQFLLLKHRQMCSSLGLTKQLQTVDSFMRKRVQADHKKMRRRLMKVNDETHQETLLQSFSLALSSMTFSPIQPLTNRNYVVCRAAVAAALDDICSAEIKLNRDSRQRASHSKRLSEQSSSSGSLCIDRYDPQDYLVMISEDSEEMPESVLTQLEGQDDRKGFKGKYKATVRTISKFSLAERPKTPFTDRPRANEKSKSPSPDRSSRTKSKTTLETRSKTSLVTTSNLPVRTTSKTSLVTTSNLPVRTTSKTSLVTTSKTSLVTTSNLPVRTTSKTSLVTTSNLPLRTRSKTSLVTTSNLPLRTTSETSLVTTSNLPLRTTSKTSLVTTSNLPLRTRSKQSLVTTSNLPVRTRSKQSLVTKSNLPLRTTSKASLKAASSKIFEQQDLTSSRSVTTTLACAFMSRTCVAEDELGREMYRQYREKLYAYVRERLGQLLEALQPIIKQKKSFLSKLPQPEYNE